MSDEELRLFLHKYKENGLSEEEYLRFRTWVAQSPENRLLIENFIKLYKLEQQCRAAERIDLSQAWQTFCRRRRNRSLRRMVCRAAMAACLIGVLWGLALYFLYPDEPSSVALNESGNRSSGIDKKSSVVLTLSDGQEIELRDSVMTVDSRLLDADASASARKGEAARQDYHQVSVPEGGRFELVLPDGTKVWINSASVFRFPSCFTDMRRVELEGEAFFEVAKSNIPFEVRTSGMTVRVLGTRFNVSAYREYPLQATLVQGGVEVESAGEKVRLTPGQQAEIKSGHASIAVREVNTDIYTAWMMDAFNFENVSLEDIVSLLSRWYGAEMEFASPALRSIRYSGTILRKESLDYVLEMIQKVSDVEFVKGNGNKVIVKMRK